MRLDRLRPRINNDCSNDELFLPEGEGNSWKVVPNDPVDIYLGNKIWRAKDKIIDETEG